MPYILNQYRDRYDPAIGQLAARLRDDCPAVMRPGHINYVLTRLLRMVLGDDPAYVDFAEAIGALECCKLELYRTRVGPYEDAARKRNGDVL